MMRVVAAVVVYLLVAGAACPVAAAPEGQVTWAVHISLAPAWFDPGEAPGLITPFMVFSAVHDALVKPMPGNPMAPSLAESWSVSKDGLTYEFVLRRNARFHDGSPVTSTLRKK
jgi:peptide/nickel transport system substrate-binding protein